MQIGVPRGTQEGGARAGVVPSGVRVLVDEGHQVLIESGAGRAGGHPDDAYAAAGGVVVSDAAAVFRRADLIVQVVGPSAAEIRLLRRGQILFASLHLAAHPERARALVERGVSAVACEMFRDPDGDAPLASAAGPREPADAMLPAVVRIAGGLEDALRDDPRIRSALVVHDGRVTSETLARALGLPFTAGQAAR